MKRTLGSALAIIDLAAAVACFEFAVGFWKSGQQSENAGLGILALVAFALAVVTVAIALGVVVVAWGPGFRGSWIFIVAGLVPPVLVAPFVVDAYHWSTRRSSHRR